MIKLYLKHIHNVNGHIQQLEFDSDQKIQFNAGQYLELIIPNQKDLYFTIASSPSEKRLILLIENKTAELIKQHCSDNGFVETKSPQGECHIHNFPKEFTHLILIASGSGFSQVRAICQDILLNKQDLNVTFIWGSAEFFEHELMETWKSKIHIIMHKFTDLEQKHQQLQALCLNSIPSDLSTTAIIACASPDFIYPLKDTLVSNGLNDNMMLADVFQFMPRR